MTPALENKKKRLLARLRSWTSVAVAFSGGVDSSLLLALAKEALGDRVTAITALSVVHPPAEIAAARQFASRLELVHLEFDSREMTLDAFLANGPDRCYVCKKQMLADILAMARRLGIDAVVHGANGDDLVDFRPGLAAAEQLGVVAPLVDAGLGKADVRRLARAMGLSVWNRPAMACLATRIPYGVPITSEALSRVARAEASLHQSGFAQCRVRMHGRVARIEVPPEDLDRLLSPADRSGLVRDFRRIGFDHVAVDLEGYLPGSMNRALTEDGRDKDSLYRLPAGRRLPAEKPRRKPAGRGCAELTGPVDSDMP